jgi:hypothetical protein
MSIRTRSKPRHWILALLLVPVSLIAVVPAAEANNVTFGLSFGFPVVPPPVVVGPPPVMAPPPPYYPPAYYPPAYYPPPYYPAPYYAPPPVYYYPPVGGFYYRYGYGYGGHRYWRH